MARPWCTRWIWELWEQGWLLIVAVLTAVFALGARRRRVSSMRRERRSMGLTA